MTDKAWKTIKRISTIFVIICILTIIGYITYETIFIKNKELNTKELNTIEKFKHSFQYERYDTNKNLLIFTNLTNKLPVEKDSTNNDTTKYYYRDIVSHLLDHSSNILGDTSNILAYLTIIIAIIAVVAGIGIYKIKKLEEGIEAANRNILDSALVTIAAVPFIEATQITSSEYYRAIDNITKTVKEKRDIVEKESKYAPLLIVEALDNWKNGDYNKTIKILKKAYKLADQSHSKELKEEIAFHLARAYKQNIYRYYIEEKLPRDKKYNEYIKDCIEYANNTSKTDEKVIKLSLALIRNKIEKNDQKEIVKSIFDCFNKKSIENLKEEYPDDYAKWTAMTTIALCKNNIDNFNNNNIRNQCAKKSLMRLKETIHSEAGSNVRAAWYFTMARLDKVIYDSESNDNDKKRIKKEIKIYIDLANIFYKKAERGNIKYLFTADYLAEIKLKDYDEKLKKFKNVINNEKNNK